MARPPGKAGFAAGPVGTVMPRPPAPADAATGVATDAATGTVAIASGGPRARR